MLLRLVPQQAALVGSSVSLVAAPLRPARNVPPFLGVWALAWRRTAGHAPAAAVAADPARRPRRVSAPLARSSAKLGSFRSKLDICLLPPNSFTSMPWARQMTTRPVY